MRPLQLAPGSLFANRFDIVMWLLVLAIAFLISAPTSARALGPHPAQPILDGDEIVPYTGAWEYHWGDSPRDSSSKLVWARPITDAAALGTQDFRPCTLPGVPPGRANSRFLWLRTRLAGPSISDPASRPALFLMVVDQIFEAYLDGKLVYRFGTIDGDDSEARRFAGYKAHYIPLGDDYQGKTLALRVYSDHVNIGVYGDLYIGSQLALTQATQRWGLGKILVGTVLAVLGLLFLALFALRREEPAYFYFGGFALSAGIWTITQAQSRALLLDNALLWVYVEFWSVYLLPPFIIHYLMELIGKGPFDLTRRLAQVYWLYIFVAALLVISGAVPLLVTWLPFVFLMMFTAIYLAGMTLLAVMLGNVEARIYGTGLCFAVLLFLYDALTSLGLLPRRDMTTSHIGLVVFVISLGIIPVRRMVLLHQQLKESALELAEKLRVIEEKNAKVRSLNDELMRQIEQRSRRLLETLLARQSDEQSGPTSGIALLSPQDMLGEAYRVERLIGQGAFGAVYEVERLNDGQRLAAKILTRTANRNALVRFAREAQLLAKFSHENLVGIIDVDVTADGKLYIIMELVKGTTLRQLHARYGDPAFALPVLRQITLALAAVHERGIVHRDLKPANILVEDQNGTPHVKLADFGISVLARGEPPSQDDDTLATRKPRPSTELDDLTGTGMLVGTLMYMAPELCVGSRHAQTSSDLFSLGAIAHELLTRTLPFKEPAISAMLRQESPHLQSTLRTCPGLTDNLAHLLERCLSLDPTKRPTAQDLALALH